MKTEERIEDSPSSNMRPTIDPDSPVSSMVKKLRANCMKQRMPKYAKHDYAKMYYVMYKYRKRQRQLLEDNDIEDPDPYDPTYVFYCFTGKPKD